MARDFHLPQRTRLTSGRIGRPLRLGTTSMIRTTLSFCLLFGGLLLVSKWLHQSVERQPAETAKHAPLQAVDVDTAPADARPIPAGQPAAALEPTCERTIQLVAF